MTQEPYITTPRTVHKPYISTIPGIPPFCGMIHHTLNPRVATLVPATSLNYVVNHVSRDIIVVTIKTENILTLINIYASLLEDFEPIVNAV